MKAMIFAAGLGTRLKPFTDHSPKALVPVASIPMLQRVITRIMDAGIHDIVINVHHMADQIYAFLKANDNFGADIVVCDESSQLLNTGGGILNAKAFLSDGPFLLHNADILTDASIGDMVKAHRRTGADVTLLTRHRQTSRYLYFAPDSGRMQGWSDLRDGSVRPLDFKPDDSLEMRAYGGVGIISPTVFVPMDKYAVKAGRDFGLIPFLSDYAAKLNIRSFDAGDNYMWHDIGTTEKKAEAEQHLLQNNGR